MHRSNKARKEQNNLWGQWKKLQPFRNRWTKKLKSQRNNFLLQLFVYFCYHGLAEIMSYNTSTGYRLWCSALTHLKPQSIISEWMILRAQIRLFKIYWTNCNDCPNNITKELQKRSSFYPFANTTHRCHLPCCCLIPPQDEVKLFGFQPSERKH